MRDLKDRYKRKMRDQIRRDYNKRIYSVRQGDCGYYETGHRTSRSRSKWDFWDIYDRDMEPVLEVLMGEIAITSNNEDKNVLATYGAGPCVIFAGRQKGNCENKLAWMAHIDPLTVVNLSFALLLNKLDSLSENKPAEFDVWLYGGDCDVGEEMISFLKSNLNNNDNLKMEISHEEFIKGHTYSLAIDAGNGVFTYDPMINPNSRGDLSFNPAPHILKLIYSPSEGD